jgi:hypothetical protein
LRVDRRIYFDERLDDMLGTKTGGLREGLWRAGGKRTVLKQRSAWGGSAAAAGLLVVAAVFTLGLAVGAYYFLPELRRYLGMRRT